MSLLLRHSGDVPPASAFEFWFATTDSKRPLPDHQKWQDVAFRLEAAYDRCAESCWSIGLALAKERGAEIARTPTMGAYGTDFRLMLGWIELARELNRAPDRYLMICDDPWLFREIADLDGILTGARPLLWPRLVALRLRGGLSRAKTAGRLALTSFLLRRQRGAVEKDRPALVVYGHPASSPDGTDAYFGDLMRREPRTQRLLHSDCGLRMARTLGGSGRTASLHAWGNPLFAIRLVVARWRRPKRKEATPYPWIVRRAQEVENSGAGPAMARWQIHCQGRWIADAHPTAIVWPWENFAWERALCRQARRNGIPATGYQHTVVGYHQINFSARLNPDGVESLPDRIVCNGPGYRRELEAWGHAPETMPIGGAFRIAKPRRIDQSPVAPVYFALSGLLSIAREQIKAARKVADTGREVLFRDHPMYPLDVDEHDHLRRSPTGMLDQKQLSAVVYSTGTSGLEAIMAGLSTVRFLPDDRVAIQVLPSGVDIPCATRETIVEVLEGLAPPPHVNWDDIFTPVDYSCWHSILS